MTDAELIAALEAAPGPSRELDAEIALLQGWTYEKRDRETKPWWRDPEGSRPLDWVTNRPPRFTESIDAALTLVGPNFAWTLGLSHNARTYSAFLYPLDETVSCVVAKDSVATPAIALCIAALKARADE